MPNKITDDEIIKAFKDCNLENATLYLYNEKEEKVVSIPTIEIFDLINRQKAEIERLKLMINRFVNMYKCIYLSDDETSESCVEAICPQFKTEAMIKTETVKELANILESRVVNKSPITVFGYKVAILEIDEILKEMVVENDENL